MPIPSGRQTVSLLAILLLSAAVMRPVQSHSQPASPTPGAPNFDALLKTSSKLAKTARFSECIEVSRRAYAEANSNARYDYAAKYLNNIGVCQLLTFQFRDALTTFLAARELLIRLKKSNGYVDANISTIYLQMGNLDAALESARSGVETSSRGDSRFRPLILIQYAKVLAKRGDIESAERWFGQAIEEASRVDDWRTVALALDLLGYELTGQARYAEADRALTEAFRLRTIHKLGEKPSSYRNLGRLRLLQGDLPSASNLLDRAVEELKISPSSVPVWAVYAERGSERLAQDRLPEAVSDLRFSLGLIRSWRVEVIESDNNRVGSEGGLASVYGNFVEAGNRSYLRNGDAALARETFEVAEENRASSLRALLPTADDWRQHLPPKYFETLQKLQQVERSLLRREDGALRTESLQLRSALDRMESAQASKRVDAVRGNALDQAQRMLGSDYVLLSFHLGERDSWLWAVSATEFALYRLPPGAELSADATAFASLLNKGEASAALGEALYRKLFGMVDRRFQSQSRWILALDRELFTLPFAALISGHDRNGPVYFGQNRAYQITTGALMLARNARATDLSGAFVGVADPIYNRADSRWKPAYRTSMWPFARRSPDREDWSFARLIGSQGEIDSCARLWGPVRSVILTGATASKSHIETALSRKPSVIHFATHFVEADRQSKSAMIALSLTQEGKVDFLSSSEIMPRATAARLVVLSGCSSGVGTALPGTGMLGLTRSWLAAGAGAVIATGWAVPDDTGQFLESFYRHALDDKTEGLAEALRKARVDMINSGTWRAKPGYWGAYFLVGNS